MKESSICCYLKEQVLYFISLFTFSSFRKFDDDDDDDILGWLSWFSGSTFLTHFVYLFYFIALCDHIRYILYILAHLRFKITNHMVCALPSVYKTLIRLSLNWLQAILNLANNIKSKTNTYTFWLFSNLSYLLELLKGRV